ncbi:MULTISPECIES: ribokinase [Kamptonema]|uniref:ribokinase n=1 Tax=Kamptonema TaxID=1501433 RepID=UPI0001DACDF2|nr:MULTISPECIES: ribokinase [Kamptonema]CBN57581.1 Ribokinase [Kamptonema sp. PCC 6506]
MSIIVFGSINIDLIAKTPRLPLPGETLLGHNFFTAGGGKGANQAVATSQLGITTHLIGRVGGDHFGQELLTNLQFYGLNTDKILIDKSTHSGIAIIAVEDSGQNNIIVVPGANNCINDTDLERLKEILPTATALLLQLEIPLQVVQAAAKLAREASVKVILDPAPFRSDIPTDFYPLIDIITPNEIEASQLVGFPVNNPETATQAADQLRHLGVNNAIIKLGSKGVVCATADETFFIPAFTVEAVDTVAAGDAFNGGLAAALDTGLSLREAVVWGAAAGALCATKNGAQSAMCDRATFDAALATNCVTD